MTDVALKYRRIDGLSLDGSLITVGAVTITPLARRDTTTGQMTTTELTVQLAPTPPTVTLAPGEYRFRVRGPGVDITEFRLVPASGMYDVDDLDETSGSSSGGGGGVAGWEAAIADLQAQINALVADGASSLSAITDMSSNAKTLLHDPNSYATMLGLLGGASTSDLAAKAPLASPALTGNPTAPTPTAGDNDTSVATTAFVQAAISTAPTINNVTLTGTVTIPDNALAIADVSGLAAALTDAGAASYIPYDWDGIGPFVRPSTSTTKRYEVIGPLPAPPIASPSNTGTDGMYENDRFTLLES